MADPALASGHEGGLASPLKQLVRTGRGFPEGLIEA
tara:strand:+ start:598 stop:705 length:108 start_codon:yes stop_codon:yes gene_type:complete